MESHGFKTHPEPLCGTPDPETNAKASKSVGNVNVIPPIFIYTQSVGLHCHRTSVLWLRLQEVLLESLCVHARLHFFSFFLFFACAAALGFAPLHFVNVYISLHMFISLFFSFFSLSVRLKPEHPCREDTVLQQGRIRSREVNNKYSALGVAYD